MVTSLVLSRTLVRPASGAASRVVAVTSRNFYAIRHSGYWLVLISGFFEPVLYLLSIGVGVGGLVGDFQLPDGRTVSYAAFVAPAMLAASAMNGALAESTFNFFARMKWVKLYDGMVATPLRPFEIALGELSWALIRGLLYSIAFLALMVWLGLTTAGWAVTAMIASLFVGLAFGGLGMSVATLLRTWQDFDYLGIVQFALFLFSGTFAPVASYPPVMQWIIRVTPLYQAVELVRDLSTGHPSWATLGHVAYLAIMGGLGLSLASRRMGKLLCK